MTVPVLVASAGAVSSGGATSTPVPKPSGVQLGDLLAVSFVMNGTPTLPTGWTLAELANNADAIMYARVDGVNIPAVNDGQTFTFGDGGGAVYYSSVITLVRGAVAAGDPFDGAFTFASGTDTTTTPVGLTTTVDDVLLLLFAHNVLSGTPTVTNVTAPLVVADGSANVAHLASVGQTTPGATGNKVVTYGAATAFNFAQFGAIQPAPDTPSGEGVWTPGGRERFTARRTPANRRRSR